MNGNITKGYTELSIEDGLLGASGRFVIQLSPHMDEDLHPGKGRPPAQGQPTGQVESWALTLQSGFGAPGSMPVEMGDKYDSCHLSVSLEGLALKWGRQGRVGHKKGIELACPPLQSALGEQLWEGPSGGAAWR